MTKRHPSTLITSLACAALLAGCAGQATKTLPAGALICEAATSITACGEAIASVASTDVDSTWSMQGRAAISTGQNAGNARIDWRQRAVQDYSVTLSAPITRQSWQLEVTNGNATITGLEGGPRTGSDAAALLRGATGWDIPVHAMRDWLRGKPAASPAPSRYVFDNVGRLIRLQQEGWQIDFENQRADGLPGRITATRADSRVRLVIDQWGDATGE